MKDINITVLVGRLTKDGELKYAKSGLPILAFSLAVNRSVKQGDQWKDEASFIDCEYMGKPAEAVARYLTKGQQVGVEGELKQDRWEQNGQTRSKLVVSAHNVRLMGGQSAKNDEVAF